MALITNIEAKAYVAAYSAKEKERMSAYLTNLALSGQLGGVMTYSAVTLDADLTVAASELTAAGWTVTYDKPNKTVTFVAK